MVHFLYLNYFWFSLAVPVIILINIRLLKRETVYSPSLIIWREVLREQGTGGAAGFLKRIVQIVLKCALVVCAAAMLAGIYTAEGHRSARVFVLDNTASMSCSLSSGSTPYAKAKNVLNAKIRSGDLVYILSPRVERTAAGTVPQKASWSETETAEAVKIVISHNKGKRVFVLTDNSPPEGFSPAGKVDWYSYGEPVSTVGILTACRGNTGLYVTLRNTFADTKTVSADILISSGRKISRTVEAEPGMHEVLIETGIHDFRYCEISIRNDDDAWEADNYYCSVQKGPDREVYVSGEPLPACFTSFYEAYSVHAVNVSVPRGSEINAVRGILPESVPPGQYLLLEPEGRIHTLRFSRLGKNVPGMVAVSESPDTAVITEHAEFPSGIQVPLTHTVEGNGIHVLKAGGVPAAGYFDGGGYRIVYFLFPVERTDIPLTPAFPVMMQNIMDFLGRVSFRFSLKHTGEPVPFPAEEMRVMRNGTAARVITPSGEDTLYLEEPGLYTADGRVVMGVNPLLNTDDLTGEKGRFSRGQHSLYPDGSGRDLFLSFWISAVACISVLALLEK